MYFRQINKTRSDHKYEFVIWNKNNGNDFFIKGKSKNGSSSTWQYSISHNKTDFVLIFF